MAMRDYRKGNWTVEETMILIEAKQKDDERRKLSRSKSAAFTPTVTSCSSSSSGSKPITELRWKWVEEYCWGKGCFRSQNQCNDKWDNLMRDYKKVRDYQKNYQQNKDENIGLKSYWDMDKIQRKDKGLPTNMIAQIYQALSDVVERSSASSTLVSTAAEAAQFFLPPPSTVVEMLQTSPSLLPSTAAMRLSSRRLPPGLPLLPPVFQSASEPPPPLPTATLFGNLDVLSTLSSNLFNLFLKLGEVIKYFRLFIVIVIEW